MMPRIAMMKALQRNEPRSAGAATTARQSLQHRPMKELA
jgi:hypothetical protein